MNIRIDKILVSKSRRPIDKSKVQQIAQSIHTIGLLSPITVNKDLSLIAGNHRLEAVKLLKWAEIPCTVVDVSVDAAKLIELDENLMRKELHYLEQAEQLLERKEIYGRMPKASRVTFSKDTSDSLDISMRSVQRLIQLAKNLIPELVSFIKESNIPKRDALKLAGLPKDKAKIAMEILDKSILIPRRDPSIDTGIIYEDLPVYLAVKKANSTAIDAALAETIAALSEKELDAAGRGDLVISSFYISENGDLQLFQLAPFSRGCYDFVITRHSIMETNFENENVTKTSTGAFFIDELFISDLMPSDKDWRGNSFTVGTDSRTLALKNHVLLKPVDETNLILN